MLKNLMVLGSRGQVKICSGTPSSLMTPSQMTVSYTHLGKDRVAVPRLHRRDAHAARGGDRGERAVHTVSYTHLSMKRGIRVINLARGEIVQDDAMIPALETGRVAAYITDFPKMCIRDSSRTGQRPCRPRRRRYHRRCRRW